MIMFFSALEAGVRHHIRASVKPPSDVALAGSMACAEDIALPSASGYIGQLPMRSNGRQKNMKNIGPSMFRILLAVHRWACG